MMVKWTPEQKAALDDFFSGWDPVLDEHKTLHENVTQNLVWLLEHIATEAHIGVQLVPGSETENGNRQVIVEVWPLSIDDHLISFKRTEETWYPGDDHDDDDEEDAAV